MDAALVADTRRAQLQVDVERACTDLASPLAEARAHATDVLLALAHSARAVDDACFVLGRSRASRSALAR